MPKAWSGKTELEEAYGMDLAAPFGSGPRDPSRSGVVSYTAGHRPSPQDWVNQRAVSSRSAQGTPWSAQSFLEATRLGDSVAVITVRLPVSGYRTVLISGTGGLMELWRDSAAGTPSASRKHNAIVRVTLQYLVSEQIVAADITLARLTRARRILSGAPTRPTDDEPTPVPPQYIPSWIRDKEIPKLEEADAELEKFRTATWPQGRSARTEFEREYDKAHKKYMEAKRALGVL